MVGPRLREFRGRRLLLRFYRLPDRSKPRQERDGARIIVDRKSYLYLNGTELDYADDLMQSGFNLQNPNVKRSCGCGASFGV